MNTKEMLDSALALAGVKECPADSGVIVPGENIKRVLVGLDINNPELALAKAMGYDCVVGLHPTGPPTSRDARNLWRSSPMNP